MKRMKKEFERILINKDKEGKVFYVPTITKDFHTQFGFVKKEDLKKKRGVVKSNLGVEFFIMEPSVVDLFKKIRRGPQIINFKDIGLIIAETGINKRSVVVDAGTGSGFLAINLALRAKKVVSYEVRKDFYDVALENKEMFEKVFDLKNLVLKNKSIEDIQERNVDVIILDLPEPWLFIKKITPSLRIGGFLVTYLPTITQVMRLKQEVENMERNMVKNKLQHLKTTELIERDWFVDGRRVRPKNNILGHTAFISFYRRLL